MSVRIHTVPVLGWFALVEVSGGKPTHMYAALFRSREDALIYRIWLERWRETYPFDAPVDVQEELAEALRNFSPADCDLGSLLTAGEVLDALLASEMGKHALRGVR